MVINTSEAARNVAGARIAFEVEGDGEAVVTAKNPGVRGLPGRPPSLSRRSSMARDADISTRQARRRASCPRAPQIARPPFATASVRGGSIAFDEDMEFSTQG